MYGHGQHPDARRAEGGASGRVFHSPNMGERPAIALPTQLDGSRTISIPRGPSSLAHIAYPNPLSDAADSAIDCSSTDRWHGPAALPYGPRGLKSILWWLASRPQPETRWEEAVASCRTVALKRVAVGSAAAAVEPLSTAARSHWPLGSSGKLQGRPPHPP